MHHGDPQPVGFAQGRAAREVVAIPTSRGKDREQGQDPDGAQHHLPDVAGGDGSADDESKRNGNQGFAHLMQDPKQVARGNGAGLTAVHLANKRSRACSGRRGAHKALSVGVIDG